MPTPATTNPHLIKFYNSTVKKVRFQRDIGSNESNGTYDIARAEKFSMIFIESVNGYDSVANLSTTPPRSGSGNISLDANNLSYIFLDDGTITENPEPCKNVNHAYAYMPDSLNDAIAVDITSFNNNYGQDYTVDACDTHYQNNGEDVYCYVTWHFTIDTNKTYTVISKNSNTIIESTSTSGNILTVTARTNTSCDDIKINVTAHDAQSSGSGSDSGSGSTPPCNLSNHGYPEDEYSASEQDAIYANVTGATVGDNYTLTAPDPICNAGNVDTPCLVTWAIEKDTHTGFTITPDSDCDIVNEVGNEDGSDFITVTVKTNPTRDANCTPSINLECIDDGSGSGNSGSGSNNSGSGSHQ